jgi:hypothetical protein
MSRRLSDGPPDAGRSRYSALKSSGVCLVMCLAQNQRTAAVAFSYAAAIFESQPLLAGLVTNRTVDTLTLSTG